ncbi:von Willebrand factor A domain-containing protein 3B [Lingula anatina]|uniref:von Willebrand factor A domain-containing protein 3B n=1 Tax=Lingula anatina TaxID=7574 RepID=A0A1S3HNE2_LINAN|nr:von Willebrand factor A domain-containing protein 3B [Lingula anatina]|eukprot:XP_013387557.1 von Willebrand factor A domain-containing protein 3B [Lingula anatina]
MPIIGFKHMDDYDYALKKPISSRYGEGMFSKYHRTDGTTFNLTCNKEQLKQIESRLIQAVLLYKRRLEWLTTESRRIFGVIEEHCICIVLDIKNLSPQQFDQYRSAFERVLVEQVAQIAKFNLIRSAEDMVMFKPELVPVTQESLQEAKDWLWNLDRCAAFSNTATCEAVLKAMTDRNVEAVYLFTEGSASDGSRELLRTKLHGGPLPLHVASYNATSVETVGFLKQLCEVTGGKFHAYGVIMEMDAYEGVPVDPNTNRANIVLKRKTFGGVPQGAGVREDVIKVFEELEEARNTLSQIQALIEDMPDQKMIERTKSDTALSSRGGYVPRKPLMTRQSSMTDTRGRKAVDYPPPPPKEKSEQYMSSKEWLEMNGLKAKKLGFYDILGGVAFKHCDGVVDLNQKPDYHDFQTDARVQPKLINARYCDKFAHVKWKNGKVVHVQVTPEVHRSYERRVNVVLDSLQQRIDWLQQGSRELFGTVIEDQIYILIDTSGSMAPSIQFVKDKLFVLMQEQLRHKQKFNLVSFNSKISPWKDRCVEVNEKNLQAAWTWIKNLECVGSTNTLAALQFALADHATQAVYLLTDGRPDQPPRSILAQVQLQHAVPLHTISFNCSDKEANQFLCQLAKDTGGRYHYYSEHGQDPDNPSPWESEDIRLLRKELELGKENLQKIADLRDECAALAWKKENVRSCSKNHKLSSTDRVSTVPALNPSELYRSPGSNRPKSATGYRSTSHSTPTPPPRPSSATGYRPRSAGAGGRSARNRTVSCPRPASARRPLVAGHTRTSLLRTLSSSARFSSNEWLLPETRELFDKQAKRLEEEVEGKVVIEKKRKKRVSNPNNMSAKMWLKHNGLLAKKLTILDALAPTMIEQNAKHIPVLDAYALSKVFDDSMPFAHVSNRRHIHLVNPDSVDLKAYENKVSAAVEKYKKRLDAMVWKALPATEREQFGSTEPISFEDNKLALLQALERCGWPVKESDILAMEGEISQGRKYLLQSEGLRKASEKHGHIGCSEKSESENDDASSVASSPRSMSSKGSKSSKGSRSPKGSQTKSPRGSVASSKDYEGLGEAIQSKSVKEKDKVLSSPATQRKVRKVLDTLRGQSVIARLETDGLYYPGMVIKCTDSRHALVELHDNGKHRIATRFIIPTGGAVSRPPLREGDYVLARVKNSETERECYVPGIVQVTPLRSMDQARFFTVQLYTGQEATCMRNYLIKISKTRYAFAVRYISEVGYENEDSVHLEIIPTPRSTHDKTHMHDGGVAKSDGGSSSRSSRSGSPRSRSRSRSRESDNEELIATHRSNATKHILKEHQEKLESLQNTLKEHIEKHNDQQRKLRRQARKLAKRQKRLQKEQRKAAKKGGKTLSKESLDSRNQEETQSKKSRTEEWLSDQNSSDKEDEKKDEEKRRSSDCHDSENEDSQRRAVRDSDNENNQRRAAKDSDNESEESEDNNSEPEHQQPAVNRPIVIPSIVRLRQSLPPADVGEEVLARWSDDGWYYRGTIRENCGDCSYFVEDGAGDMERIYREDIITDNDDVQQLLQERGTVVARHPSFSFSYAPAVVLSLYQDLQMTVRFYDGTEAKLPYEEVYRLAPEKFEHDVDHILKCEDQWVGQAVVARNDLIGTYHLGEVKKRIGNGRQYVVEWADGNMAVVMATNMFGACTKRHNLCVGERVLAVADDDTLLYLPGTVTAVESDRIGVRFSDGTRSNSVDPVQCFWLSEDYYEDTLAFFQKKSRQLTDV